jgi:hypothetical protein
MKARNRALGLPKANPNWRKRKKIFRIAGLLPRQAAQAELDKTSLFQCKGKAGS